MHKQLNDIVFVNYQLEYPIPDIAKDIDWKKILPPPPANDSDITKREILQVSSLTDKLSYADRLLVYQIDDDANSLLYKYIIEQNISFSIDYFRSIYRIIRPILLNIKYFYNRPRPYDLAPYYNIPINIISTETHHTPAYPSGHTVYTSLACEIIRKQYPNNAEINNSLDNIVNTTARCRMMQGVHYNSDNEGSIKLANILYNFLYSKLEKQYHG
jgi:acid phosphatase (class A)